MALTSPPALVLGAGVGGLLGAAALRRHFSQVTLVERDTLPRQPIRRRGVPQGGQLHNLLGAAQRALDELLPGVVDELVAEGAVRGRVSTDTYVHELGLRMPTRDLGLFIVTAPRPLIEHVLRDRIMALGGVEIRERTSVEELILRGRCARSVAVRSGPVRSLVEADLVVDALGASSPIARQLRGLGCASRVEQRPVRQWYVSAQFRQQEALGTARQFLLVFPTPPATRGGLVSPVDGGDFYVSLNGGPNDSVPRTAREMRDYAATLEDLAIAELLTHAEPTTEPTAFHQASTTWYHHEELDEPLSGLLPLGDSMAVLNPLFGQGMSVAAQQAVALAGVLGEVSHPAARTRAYLERAAEMIRRAWELGTLVEGGRGWRRSYTDAGAAQSLGEQLAADPCLHAKYVQIWHLLTPTSALDHLGHGDESLLTARVAKAEDLSS